MSVTPQDVARAARAYLGVRWQHQGRNRHGLDCIGLCVCVARDLGVSDADAAGYPRIPRDPLLAEGLRTHCTELHGEPNVGMIALLAFDGAATHVGILGDHPAGGLTLIHSYVINRRVVEHRMDAEWRGRIVALFDFPGVVR